MRKIFYGILLAIFLYLIISTVFLSKNESDTQNLESTESTTEDITATKNYPTIVLDAGHGGFDPGKVGINGALEKDINLDISIKLNDILSVFGYKTKMIRNKDIDLHLTGDTIRQRKISDIQERYKIMNSIDDCLYISVHQNKFNDARIHGAQTFYSPNYLR